MNTQVKVEVATNADGDIVGWRVTAGGETKCVHGTTGQPAGFVTQAELDAVVGRADYRVSFEARSDTVLPTKPGGFTVRTRD